MEILIKPQRENHPEALYKIDRWCCFCFKMIYKTSGLATSTNPSQMCTTPSGTAVSSPLLCYAMQAPWDRFEISGTSEIAFLESTRIVTVFYAQAMHKKIEIKHFSVFLQHPNTVCCIFLSSDHSHSRDKPHSIINDAVRQKGKKLNGVRLRSALENNIKYLSARYKTSSLLEKKILHLEST